MINTYAYDVEILPNFFSVTFIDIKDYLNIFSDAVVLNSKNENVPVPLLQKFTVKEIKNRLAKVKKYKFYITDKDDSLLFSMLEFINNLKPNIIPKQIDGAVIDIPLRNDLFGYNSSNYDKYIIASLLMFVGQTKSTKELITKIYETSKHIISLQKNDAAKNDYFLNTLKSFKLPYTDIDVMSIFALNKVGSGKDDNGNTVYFGKSLKQTSINLQWYELLEHELPPISDKDINFYHANERYKGLTPIELNNIIDKWDRYIISEWIDDIMHYNENDVFIVCEMIRLYMDEIKLRYNITSAYKVNVLSSSRSDIANKLFEKFYSEFSGLQPFQWKGRKTERTALSFKRVIFPFISFKTKELQDLLEEMKKVIIYSIGKDSFMKEIKLGNLTYTIATGGLHTQDIPRELRSNIKYIDSPTGENIWANITNDSYIYVHFDISSFYPSLMSIYQISPEHLDKGVFTKLITWLKNTRLQAKHSKEEIIDGIQKDLLAQALKIVINSIYGKLGFEYGDLCDRLAVLKVTINGQLMILMLCEELELNNIEIISANTDGIVVKLYKKDKIKFDNITNKWLNETQLEADSENYKCYINRDINNYAVEELNGKMSYKGALNPQMYSVDLQKGYDMPIVAKAVINYFFKNISVMDTLYESKNILDFCKTQNIGKQFHVEFTKNFKTTRMQQNIRFYVSNKGGCLEKVNNITNSRNNLCAKNNVTVLNTVDDLDIQYRDINYKYYYEEAYKIIDPIKLGISPKQKGIKNKTKSGKLLIKKYSRDYSNLFEDAE